MGTNEQTVEEEEEVAGEERVGVGVYISRSSAAASGERPSRFVLPFGRSYIMNTNSISGREEEEDDDDDEDEEEEEEKAS